MSIDGISAARTAAALPPSVPDEQPRFEERLERTLLEISESCPSTFDAVQDILRGREETARGIAENMRMPEEDQEALERRREEDLERREELDERLAEERKVEA